jgi:ATP adenylyltransferase
MEECLACSLADGRRPRPGGLIHRSEHWLVEHCIGPLGLGTLIVKPVRHVTAVGDLTVEESMELGPLLRQASQVASQLVATIQVYNCLWSHAGGVPVHIHYVVQPVTREQIDRCGGQGPKLQLSMFEEGKPPDPEEVVRLAARARELFAAS